MANGTPSSPRNLAELRVADDAEEALVALRGAGFILICVTNQPDVARGKKRREEVEAINVGLCELLPLDDIMVCYHDDRDGCACRKPLPGMLLSAARKHHVDLRRSFMIGDRWRDV